MRAPNIYLNELSCTFEGHSLNTIRIHVINTIDALRAAKARRIDIAVRMNCRLRDLTLGAEHYPLAAILPEPNDRFTQFKRLLDKAPCTTYADLVSEVRCGEKRAIGLSWAHMDGSFVFSFAHSAIWSSQTIPCQHHLLDEAAEIVVNVIEICNLATMAHADSWRQRIQEYGYDPSKSSLLYEGRGFAMRMHLHDHDPAHVHIYPRPGDTRDRIARIRIDNCDRLDGALSSAMDHEIREVITRHRETLLEGWQAIKVGKLPLRLSK